MTTVWFWAPMALIIVLHITAMLARGVSKGVLTAVCSINMLLHLLLFGLMFINAAKPEAVFLAMLISLCTALLTTGHRKGDDKDGI